MHNHEFIPVPGTLRDAPNVGVKRCKACGFITHQEDVSSLVQYETGSMMNWTAGRTLDKIQTEDTNRRIRALSKILSRVQGPRSYLDFGCGDGAVVREMRLFEPRSHGYDIDNSRFPKEAEYRQSFFSSLEEIGGKEFSVVSAFHVVEHANDVVGLIDLMASRVAPNGYLVIETPNANDALLSLYDSREFRDFTFWSHHPSLCSAMFLEEVLQEAGLVLEESHNIARYGLANHLFWMIEGRPGGHKALDGLISDDTDHRYRAMLTEKGVGDTLWIVSQRPKV